MLQPLHALHRFTKPWEQTPHTNEGTIYIIHATNKKRPHFVDVDSHFDHGNRL